MWFESFALGCFFIVGALNEISPINISFLILGTSCFILAIFFAFLSFLGQILSAN
jgi:hypothetical protein